MKNTKMPDIMRALILILLGMLTFILGARLYAQRANPKTGGFRLSQCFKCPLAKDCEKHEKQ